MRECIHCEKEKTWIIVHKAISLMIEFFYSFVASYLVGSWAIEYAYNERGYFAVGGEYMLIGMTFTICFWAIRSFLERR